MCQKRTGEYFFRSFYKKKIEVTGRLFIDEIVEVYFVGGYRKKVSFYEDEINSIF